MGNTSKAFDFLTNLWEMLNQKVSPFLQKLIAEFTLHHLDKVYFAFGNIVFETLSKQADKANSEAKSAEEKAAVATSDEEKLKFAEQAKNLRANAQQFIDISTELSSKFSAHKQQTTQDVTDDASNIDLKSALSNVSQPQNITAEDAQKESP